MWPFNSPLHRGPGGPLVPRGNYAPAAPAGGAPVAPQGGMFNAWPTMLGGPQPSQALPSPGGGVPALPAPQPAGSGIGGFGSALSNMMKGGLGANALSLFGSPQGADVKEQIRQQFLASGRPDPFAAEAAPQQPQIPDLTNAQYPQPFGIGPEGVPLPKRRPHFGGIPMPQPRPDIPQPPATDYYNGPGSMSFGAGQGPSGNNYGNQGILSALFNR